MEGRRHGEKNVEEGPAQRKGNVLDAGRPRVSQGLRTRRSWFLM